LRTDVAGAKALLGEQDFDICLTDMRLPDGDGLDLVAWMQSNAAGVPVAVITAHGNVETAVQALKLGAFDFISKPLDLGNLRTIVENALKVRVPGRNGDSKLLGDSQRMRDLREMVGKVAQSQARQWPACRRTIRASQLRGYTDRTRRERVLRPPQGELHRGRA
jgi:two-component system response regulator PilR (NtrC family)